MVLVEPLEGMDPSFATVWLCRTEDEFVGKIDDFACRVIALAALGETLLAFGDDLDGDMMVCYQMGSIV